MTKTLSGFSLAFWSRERAEQRKELPVKESHITKSSPVATMECPNVVASWPFPNSECSTLCTTFLHRYSPSPAFVLHSILLLFQESYYWWLFLWSFPWQLGKNCTEDYKCAGPFLDSHSGHFHCSYVIRWFQRTRPESLSCLFLVLMS